MIETWHLSVDYACNCGMAHYHQFNFSSLAKMVRWLMIESSNIETIHNITVTRYDSSTATHYIDTMLDTVRGN